MNVLIKSLVDHIYCINLNRRPDRKEECEREFLKHDMNVEFVEAIDGNNLSTNGLITAHEIACSMSHLKVYLDAKQKGYNHIMILEDDIEFSDDLSVEETLIPFNWDLIYLGGSHIMRPSVCNLRFARVFKTFTTAGYMVNRNMLDVLIKNVNTFQKQVDVSLADIQKQYKSYCFFPSVVKQRASFSDIQKRFVEYKV